MDIFCFVYNQFSLRDNNVDLQLWILFFVTAAEKCEETEIDL